MASNQETEDRLRAALADRYAIEREIGSGGMATVYLAQDLKHDRQVAVKVLKPEVAAIVGSERFLAEIRTTANLQHPHILPLHDSGEADGFLFYVMPYVEGVSLREKLDRETQLPVEEAVKIASSVAGAIQSAHERGVIHRDIKPENILLAGDEALVTDFGIALAISQAGAGRLTETGLSLGTPHYMSPEQASGDLSVDHRSDVYSLGCILYEMLVGAPPFDAPNAQSILAKILTAKAPPAKDSRESVPVHISNAIAKALEKLPADRFVSSADFLDALQHPRALRRAGPLPTGKGRWLLGLASFAAFALGIWLGGKMLSRPGVETVRLTVSRSDIMPEGPSAGTGPSIAISPAGDRIVFVGRGTEGTQLYSRPLDVLDPTPIPGTEGASSPFFSPNGESILFMKDGWIQTMRVEGGPANQITDSSVAEGASWGNDGYIYFTQSGTYSISRVPELGGPIEPLTEPDSTEEANRHLWPRLLPDGQGVLFSIRRPNLVDSDLALFSFDTSELRILGKGIYAQHGPPGYVLFVSSSGHLFALPAGELGAETTGAIPVAEDIRFAQYGCPQVSVSSDGTVLYLSGGSMNEQHLVWVDRDGSWSPSGFYAPSDFEDMAFSPDGRRLAFTVEVEEGRTGLGAHRRRVDVYTVDLEGGRTRRLTAEGTNERPFWSPDSEHVTFVSPRDREWGIYWRAWDGSAPEEPVFTPEFEAYEGAWTSDGSGLFYTVVKPDSDRDIRYVEPWGDAVPRTVLGTESSERTPMVSRDGRLLAFTSNESGRSEVYVMPLLDPASAIRVSFNGGTEPLWARNGNRLYFRSPEGLAEAEIEAEPRLSVSQVRIVVVPPESYEETVTHTTYEVDTDDSRFLMIQLTPLQPEEAVVIFNLSRELEERRGGS